MEAFPGTLQKAWVRRPFITKTGKQGCQRVVAIVLTDDQEAWLRRWFPEVENSRLMKASGLSHSALHRFARELGLVKSEKGLRGIKKRQAAHIKRVCERNGWYDSLRGRKLSPECRAGVAKMWADIREGRREHPFQVLKREHPRKYANLMRRKSEERKETIRKEKWRAYYGLTRQTKLRAVVLNPYTRSQTCHRHSALKRGYIIMMDCSEGSGERYNIYYDDETERAPIFERNLIADGFCLKEWVDN